ncbi:MAG TPA: ferredoxin [Actinomycetales bacterium]|jgi:ferredoxin|nr:ferredoxin [Actinomycetales bacterium]
MRIIADLGKCQGYANCVVSAPEFFDLTESGKVDVLVAVVDESAVPQQAVDACPVGALRLEHA